jgi:hypothetical protein
MSNDILRKLHKTPDLVVDLKRRSELLVHVVRIYLTKLAKKFVESKPEC